MRVLCSVEDGRGRGGLSARAEGGRGGGGDAFDTTGKLVVRGTVECFMSRGRVQSQIQTRVDGLALGGNKGSQVFL